MTIRHGWWTFAVSVHVAVLLAACAGRSPVRLEGDRGASSLHEILKLHGAELRPLPTSVAAVEALSGADLVVVYRASSQPGDMLDQAARFPLRQFVHGGGSLLLLGYAARLAHELGLEPEPPDRVERFRFGVDETTALGRYIFGFHRSADLLPELTDDLVSSRPGRAVHMLGGGDLVQVQICLWQGTAPRRGTVLGRHAFIKDGVAGESTAAVLVHWQEGRGQVLALGQVPEPFRPDKDIADNARQFLHNAIHVLAGHRGSPRILFCAEPELARPPMPILDAPGSRPVPGARLAPHFGFEVPVNHLSNVRTPLAPDRIVQDAILACARAGASFVALRPADSERGYPFGWNRSDPLARPAGYFGEDFWPGWSVQQVHGIVRKAHEHSMLAALVVDPMAVRGGAPVEQLAALKWFAREMADGRRLGQGALDGFIHRDWPVPDRGVAAALLQQYQPHGQLFAMQVDAPKGFHGMLDARLGRPLDVNAMGLSEQFRLVFGPEEVAHTIVDLTTRRPSRSLWGNAAVGGGSHGDWILTQVQDFFRRRPDGEGVLIYRALHPDTLSADALRYALGLGLDPLKAAVAARLWATGRSGYRELVASLREEVQQGFGPESPLPAHTPFLQNNHFRLHGSGGSLWFDPAGQSWFKAGDAGTLLAASRFLSTEIRGARLRTDPDRLNVLNLLSGGPRPAGGYGPVVAIPAEDVGRGRFPAMLALEDAPDWPRKVEVMVQPPVGLHELELTLRGVQGQGILELRMDGELLQQFAFRSGAGSQRMAVEFPVGESAARTLSLEVVDGGKVAVEVFQLLRRGELGAEVRIVEPCGHRAELTEVTGSPYFRERARWITHADLPGFLWIVDYDDMDRQLTVVRTFGMSGYRGLRGAESELRLPFVLRSNTKGLPDLAVVPVELPRSHHFEWHEGALRLVGRPRPNQRLVVGFFFLRDLGEQVLPLLAGAFAEMAAPISLTLDGEGVARVAPLPLPWPRVFRVDHPARTAYQVLERGRHVHRGAQIAADRSDWIRVYGEPGSDVEVRSASHPVLRTRPGPGSLYRVALKDPQPDSVTATVYQVSRLSPPPSVTMEAAFDTVTLDGRPWRYFEGQTVYLPRAAGNYLVETRTLARGVMPSLVRTDAEVRRVSFQGDALEILTEGDAGLLHTAWIAGPEPVALEGAERIPESAFTYAAPQQEPARSRGFMIRFAPGLVRIRFAPDAGEGPR